jgi:hypothetical protein
LPGDGLPDPASDTAHCTSEAAVFGSGQPVGARHAGNGEIEALALARVVET